MFGPSNIRSTHVLLCATMAVGLTLGFPAGIQPADAQEREALRSFLEDTISDASSFDDRYDAEVWLVDMSARLARFVKDPKHRLELLQDIHAASAQADLPPELVLSLIEV